MQFLSGLSCPATTYLFLSFVRNVNTLLKIDYQSYIRHTEYSLTHSPSSFWKYTKNLSKHNTLPSTLRWDITTADNPRDSANLLSKYFYSMYNSSISPPFNLPTNNRYPYELPSNCLITLDDVQLALNSLKNNNSNGPDGVSARLLFNCLHSLPYISAL